MRYLHTTHSFVLKMGITDVSMYLEPFSMFEHKENEVALHFILFF